MCKLFSVVVWALLTCLGQARRVKHPSGKRKDTRLAALRETVHPLKHLQPLLGARVPDAAYAKPYYVHDRALAKKGDYTFATFGGQRIVVVYDGKTWNPLTVYDGEIFHDDIYPMDGGMHPDTVGLPSKGAEWAMSRRSEDFEPWVEQLAKDWANVNLERGETMANVESDAKDIADVALERNATMVQVEQLAKDLANAMLRKPFVSDVARKVDAETDGNYFQSDEYYDRLNDLYMTRRAHDDVYNRNAFLVHEDRQVVETLPAVNRFRFTPDTGKLNGALRQKGLDGERFVTGTADPEDPNSHYLRYLSKELCTYYDCIDSEADALLEQLNFEQEGSKNPLRCTQFLQGHKYIFPNVHASKADGIKEVISSLYSEIIKRRRIGKSMLKAQTLWSRIVARTDEIYEVAERLLDPYTKAVLQLVHSAGMNKSHVIFGPVKNPVRIHEKGLDEYSKGNSDLGDGVIPEAWVGDVLRCIVVAEDAKQMLEFQKLLSQQDGTPLGGRAGDVGLSFLRNKNKFADLIPSHFRFFLNNFQLRKGNLSMLCEIQVHHKAIKEEDDKLESHKLFSFFRDYMQNKYIEASRDVSSMTHWAEDLEDQMKMFDEIDDLLLR